MQIQDKIIPDQKIAVINYKGPISVWKYCFPN